ncbi:MAG: hypothetical protein OSB70_12005 [Myxococcota bacterium]|nr:hypothetical protein [Myxococcota bacterium]
MTGWIVYAVFFLSGLSGLIYQVIWVRQFGLVFGNTLQSASLVSAIFLFGLGVGGWGAGILADRLNPKDQQAGLRLYSLCEAAIGALALLVGLVLIRLQGWSSVISSYTATDQGWLELSATSLLLRYLTAIALIAPITLLMGATLTLLIRFLVQIEMGEAGRRIGFLYAINTAGAAMGALLVDFIAIPALGLLRTQFVAVALNLLAAGGAFALFRRLRSASVAAVDPPPTSTSSNAQARSLPAYQVAIALALSGFAAMGMEILWFRYLTSFMGQYRVIFSVLLTVILVGIGLGSACGGALASRWRHPVRIFVLAQFAFVLSAVASILLYKAGGGISELHILRTEGLSGVGRFLGAMAQIVDPIFRLVGIPAFFMGFSYPVANAIVQTQSEDVGRRAGALYLGNTIGAVAGSLTTGFLLLPLLGIKTGGFLLLLCACLAPIPILYSSLGPTSESQIEGSGQRGFSLAMGALGLVVIFGLSAWNGLPQHYFVLDSFRYHPRLSAYLHDPYLLSASEGELESIVVLEIPEEHGRTLYTNGHSMSATSPQAQRYMRAFTHIPLLQMEEPRDVLVICFGVGNTLHSASLHGSIENLEIVDLSRHVLKHASFFAATNGDVLEDDRVSVFINDGRQHLRMQDVERYDLITMEPPPVDFAGVASLYSREFYELVRSRLKPGGRITQWLPIREVPGEISKSMVRAMLDVFPDTVMLAASYADLILMATRDGEIQFDPDRYDRRLAESPAVEADLARYEMNSAMEILGMFSANSETLAAATRDSAPVTDDNPILEYARHWYPRESIPTDLFAEDEVASWCPACMKEGRLKPRFALLPTYLEIMATIHDAPQYWDLTARDGATATLDFGNHNISRIRRVVATSSHLQRLIPELAPRARHGAP